MRTLPTLILLGAIALGGAGAQPAAPRPLTMVVDADQGRDTISRHLYGHFAEHLGRGIYDGIWIRRGSEWRIRDDVVQALRAIRVPNLRWPGGCFADYYQWKDGIGPRAERPTIVNNNWGGVTEDNGVGTHEFMELVGRLGTEPFIVGNVGSGTVREMWQWWEYVNHPGPGPMADLRRRNGRAEPWNVRFWGVGNESWGCGGGMRPEYYADVYKRFASFLPAYGDVRPFRIAAGPPGDNYHWTEVMMREAAPMIDGLDLHHYLLTGSWAKKGSATNFTEAEWAELMQKAAFFDELLTRHSTIMDRYDPAKRVWLIVGEWGTWHEGEPGSNPGFLYQQNSLRDAVAAALSLDIFNRHADRVRMANIAQTVNVLQAMILTRGEQMILTPTYHVFEFYTVHHDAVLLPTRFDAGRYERGGWSAPAVSATASRDRAGRIHLTMTNVDPTQPRTVAATIRGQRVSAVAGGRILTAEQMGAHNTFEQPNAVRPAPFAGATLAGETLTVRLPPKSIVVLELR
ncbi:MAG TPA: alpha-L-arabinofuranosidase C-terminal domain-containing protein [Gemmatimonadaceae bacterium]|nr:alpha-L-arabinofuranosidase C-terminal domain-containing protein [Gemmatimonadaceae bacterium]